MHLFPPKDEVLERIRRYFIIHSLRVSLCGFTARHSGISVQRELKLLRHVYPDRGASAGRQMDNNIIGDGSHLLFGRTYRVPLCETQI